MTETDAPQRSESSGQSSDSDPGTSQDPTGPSDIYAEMFTNRYSEHDADFMATMNKPLAPPPCVENWYSKPKRVYDWARNDQRGGRGRGGWRGGGGGGGGNWSRGGRGGWNDDRNRDNRGGRRDYQDRGGQDRHWQQQGRQNYDQRQNYGQRQDYGHHRGGSSHVHHAGMKQHDGRRDRDGHYHREQHPYGRNPQH